MALRCHGYAAPCRGPASLSYAHASQRQALPMLCRAPLGAAVPLLCRASAKRHSAVAMRPSRCFSIALPGGTNQIRSFAPLRLAKLFHCVASPCSASAVPRTASPCPALPRRAVADRGKALLSHALPCLCFRCAGQVAATRRRASALLPCASARRCTSVLFQSISLLFHSGAFRHYAIPLHGSGLPCLGQAKPCRSVAMLSDAVPLRCASKACFSIAWPWRCQAMLMPCRDVRVIAYPLLCRAGLCSAMPMRGHSTLCPCFARPSGSKPMRRIPSLARRSHM